MNFILLGDFHVLKDEPAGPSSPAPQQPVEVLGLDPRPPVHEERRERFARVCLGVRVRPGVHEEVVCAFGAHDEPLLAVEQEVVPLVLGTGRGAEEVRASAGLGETLCRELLALEDRADVLLFLGAGPVEDDGVADEVGPDAEDASELIPQGADLFADHTGGHPVHPPATPWLRVPNAEQVSPSRLLEELLRETDLLFVHIEDHLAGHPFHEVPDLVPDLELICREHVVEHVSPPSPE